MPGQAEGQRGQVKLLLLALVVSARGHGYLQAVYERELQRAFGRQWSHIDLLAFGALLLGVAFALPSRLAWSRARADDVLRASQGELAAERLPRLYGERHTLPQHLFLLLPHNAVGLLVGPLLVELARARGPGEHDEVCDN